MSFEDYCRAQVPPGSTLYYCARFAPAQERDVVLAAFALHRTLLDVAGRDLDPDRVHTTLQWWRAELANTGRGAPTHPLTLALASRANSTQLGEFFFDRMIAGVAAHLLPTSDSPGTYMRSIARVYGSTCALVSLLANAKIDPQFNRRLGLGWGLADDVIHSGIEIRRDRVALRADLMERHRFPISSLRALEETDAYRAVCAAQAAEARRWINRALQLSNRSQRPLLPLVILARLVLATLDECERSGWPMLRYGVELTPLHKFWISWRTSRTVNAHRD